MSEQYPLALDFRTARNVSVPLIAVNSLDPAATMRALAWSLVNVASASQAETDNEFGLHAFPILKWDIGHGLLPLNEEGKNWHAQYVGPSKQNTTINPAEALRLLEKVPERALTFILNGHRYLSNDFFIQGLWNCRDLYKANGNTIVLLGIGFKLPPELANDVVLLNEPLPTTTQLESIIKEQLSAASLPVPDPATLGKAVDATLGLGAFTAEQEVARSMQASGLNIDKLWDRKRQVIDATPGLSVWRGGNSYAQIGGVATIKHFLTQVLVSKRAPRCIVWLDEIEKSLSGSTGQASDTSGVSQALLGILLSYMQDRQASGLLLVGPNGTSKSAIAKATGAEANIPTIALDISGLKSSLVGSSEQQMRQALNVISAISQDKACFIATSNNISQLPPELIRRFGYGTWYVDLPSQDEREAIWTIYLAKFGLATDADRPTDHNWTGAEIERCARLSWELSIPLSEAAKYIVPTAISAKESIKALEAQAHQTYLSANRDGVFDQNRDTPHHTRPRTITLAQ